MSKRRNLADFAAERITKKGPPCWLCSIPEAREVNQGLRDGVKQAALLDWLRDDCGYGETATVHKVVNHLKNRHHLRTA